jgi:hypothetical protein
MNVTGPEMIIRPADYKSIRELLDTACSVTSQKIIVYPP